MNQTIRCPICGTPYTFYAHSAADQSACPDCRARAKRRASARPRWAFFRLV